MAKEVEQLDDDEGDETERMIKRERGLVKELSTCQEYHMLVNVSHFKTELCSINGWSLDSSTAFSKISRKRMRSTKSTSRK